MNITSYYADTMYTLERLIEHLNDGDELKKAFTSFRKELYNANRYHQYSERKVRNMCNRLEKNRRLYVTDEIKNLVFSLAYHLKCSINVIDLTVDCWNTSYDAVRGCMSFGLDFIEVIINN